MIIVTQMEMSSLQSAPEQDEGVTTTEQADKVLFSLNSLGTQCVITLCFIELEGLSAHHRVLVTVVAIQHISSDTVFWKQAGCLLCSGAVGSVAFKI